MNWIVITFWSYTLVVFVIGLISVYYSRNTKQDFFLADRGLGAWVAGLSGAASVESGWVTMGLVGKGYAEGLAVYWVVPATTVAFAFIWVYVAPRLSGLSRDQKSVTLTDVLSGAHNQGLSRWIRLIAVCISVGMLTLYVAAQLSAAGKMFQAAFEWDFYAGVLAGLAIALIYTITGGFRAVAWTDVVQAGLMIFAMVIVPVVLVMRLGGPAACWDGISELAQQPQPEAAGFDQWTGGKSGWGLFAYLTLLLGIPLGNLGQPHLAVRLMATRDKQAIFRGGVISVVWVTILFAGAITLGIVIRLLTEQGMIAPLDDPEHALLAVARTSELIPGWLGGLMVAAALAAICSTVDSQLLVAASNVSSDLVDHRWSAGGRARGEFFVWWSDRLTVGLVALIAMVVGLLNNESIFRFVLNYGFAGLGAAFGPALLFRLRSPDPEGDRSVLAAMVGGIGTVVAWNLLELGSYSYNLPPGILVAFLLGYLFRGRPIVHPV